jgi:hypothetical protein
MTRHDFVIFCRVLAALSPAQQWDDFTTDAWYEVFPRDYTLEECRQAAVRVKQREKWLDPSDIIAEVQRDRRPADEAANLYSLIGPGYQARREADDAAAGAALERLAVRLGRPVPQLKAVPPPDYGGKDGTA